MKGEVHHHPPLTPPTQPPPPPQRGPPAFSGEELRLSDVAEPRELLLRGPLAVRGVDTGVEMSASLDSGNLMSSRGAASIVAELSGECNSREIIAHLFFPFGGIFFIRRRGGKSIHALRLSETTHVCVKNKSVKSKSNSFAVSLKRKKESTGSKMKFKRL